MAKTVEQLLERLQSTTVDGAMLQLDDHFDGDRRLANEVIRLSKASAKLARLLSLLEDRPALAKVIQEAFGVRSGVLKSSRRIVDMAIGPETSLALADRLASYVKERLNG